MKRLFIPIVALLVFIGCNSADEPVTLDTDQLITDLETLSSDEMQGRLVGTEGNQIAREYIISRFEEIGVAPFQGSYMHDFSIARRNGDMVNGINVIARVEGKSDSVIVLSAHYDHIGVRDSLIFNGADDNASGTAGLIALADYFSEVQPNHTMIFAAFDAEEGGLNGARAFVGDSVFLQKVKLNVNMDMIAQNTKDELYAVGTYHYPDLKPLLEQVDTGGISLLFGHDRPEDGQQDWTYASDHGPFHREGVPFIYFGVEDHEHYHRHTDEFSTIPQEFYKQSVQAILNAVLVLDENL